MTTYPVTVATLVAAIRSGEPGRMGFALEIIDARKYAALSSELVASWELMQEAARREAAAKADQLATIPADLSNDDMFDQVVNLPRLQETTDRLEYAARWDVARIAAEAVADQIKA